MEPYQKIKKTCLKLGFPQDFVDHLPADILECYNKYDDFNIGRFTVLDDFNVKLCSITIHHFKDKYSLWFEFISEQYFLKKIHLTNYDKTQNYSFCRIDFDKNCDFLSLSINDGDEISDNQLPFNSCDVNIFFDFDINLNIQEINVIGYDHKNSGTLFNITHNKENMLSIDDELLLIKFIFYMYNPEIVRYVPEFYIPSAYDFASPEFQSRILLAEMLMF